MATLIVSKKLKKAKSTRTVTETGPSVQGLKAILTVPRKQRTAQQLQLLVALTKHIKVFAELSGDLGDDTHQQCCQCLSYAHSPAGSVTATQFVFHEGDAADNFYIILKGSVGVQVRRERVDCTIETKLLSVLRQGECFGELALISSQPRLASIQCREDSHFAVLSRDDYVRILAKSHERMIQQKVDTLTRIPVFKKLSKGALTRACYFFKVRKFNRKQAVFSAGDSGSELFIVKEGEFQLTKSVEIEPPKLGSPRLSKSFHCSIDVSQLSTGELIGCAEVLSSKPYAYSCFCYSTTGELLAISKKDFQQVLGNEDTMAYLAGLNEQKEEYWRQRVETATQIERKKRTPIKVGRADPATPKSLPRSHTIREVPQHLNTSAVISPHHSRTFSSLLSDSAQYHSAVSLLPDATPKLQKQKSWSQVFCSKYSLNAKPQKSTPKARTIVNFHTHSLRALRLPYFHTVKHTSRSSAPNDSLRLRLSEYSQIDGKSIL